jgi:hypothetical protein
VTSVRKRPIRLLACIDIRKPEEDEPLAHRGHDGVMTVNRWRAGRDESNLAVPRERPAPTGPDVPCPIPVINLA